MFLASPNLRILLPISLTISCLWASPAAAESCPPRPGAQAQARKLASKMYRQGLARFDQGQYADALQSFQCADRMVPAALARYWVARAAEASGKSRLALRIYRSLLPKPPAAVSKAELQQRISNVEKKMAAEARRPPPRKDPRRPPDSKPLTPEQRKRRTLRLVGWSTIGAGIAMVVAGGVVGGLYFRTKSEFEDPGDNAFWDDDGIRLQDRLKTLSATSWALMGVGAAVAVTGGVLLALGRKKERAPTFSVAPLPGGGWVSLSMDY